MLFRSFCPASSFADVDTYVDTYAHPKIQTDWKLTVKYSTNVINAKVGKVNTPF